MGDATVKPPAARLPGCCQDWAFNFVMPEGQAPIDELEQAQFALILSRVRVALDRCRAVKFAVAGIDISVNDDAEKVRLGRLKRGPKVYFQVHVYGVVRTRDKGAVWDALRHLFGSSQNIYRPLSIRPFDGAKRGLSYICKPQGFRHVSYFDEQRKEWNTPRKPPALKAREHVHYLLAMHALGFSGRIALVGLHR